MKNYDLTGANVIKAMDTPWIYCNDNMTVEEKQQAFLECNEWFYAVCKDLENNRKTMFKNYNVVYLEDYLV